MFVLLRTSNRIRRKKWLKWNNSLLLQPSEDCTVLLWSTGSSAEFGNRETRCTASAKERLDGTRKADCLATDRLIDQRRQNAVGNRNLKSCGVEQIPVQIRGR